MSRHLVMVDKSVSAGYKMLQNLNIYGTTGSKDTSKEGETQGATGSGSHSS